MPTNKRSNLPERQIINWTILQNEQSEKVFSWTKSKKEVDENGDEKALLFHKIGFVNPDTDFQIFGKLKPYFQTNVSLLIFRI
jgi:hypothetical protein